MKAKLKEKKEIVESNIPEGVNIIDLSVEKRIELYQQALTKFDQEGTKTYGVSVGVEMKFSPQGIVPRMVLVDMLKKKDENQNPGNPQETPKV